MGEIDRHIVSGPGVRRHSAYSQAVRPQGSCSSRASRGSTRRPASRRPTFGEQAMQAFSNLEAVLLAGGSRPDLVVTDGARREHLRLRQLNELFGASSRPLRPRGW